MSLWKNCATLSYNLWTQKAWSIYQVKRDRERDKEIKRERERDKERDRQTDRQTGREGGREGGRERKIVVSVLSDFVRLSPDVILFQLISLFILLRQCLIKCSSSWKAFSLLIYFSLYLSLSLSLSLSHCPSIFFSWYFIKRYQRS